MIVVDSSAIIALLKGEPEANAIEICLKSATSRLLSAANYVETGAVLAGIRSHAREKTVNDLRLILDEAAIEVAPVTPELAREALRARIRFGTGFGVRNGLNFGDCFAYALAKQRNAPLLFVGNDFSQTDVESAL